MADVVLGFALEKISTFLTEQGTHLAGLRQEIQLIGDEFGHMKAFLEKMADLNQENDDPQLTEWISQVREVSYDTQDIVDEFVLLFAGHRLPGFPGSIRQSFKSLKNLPDRYRLASKLQRVNARIERISAARLRYETQYASVLPQVAGRPAANKTWRHNKDDDALLLEETQVVGMDEPKQHLVSQLLDDSDSHLKVIAVLGMGGLGKTTLVKQVYDDPAVKAHFQIRAWVAVSQNCDFQNILRGLIQQLAGEFKESIPHEMDSMNSYQLKAFLKEFLRRGRYAIVFDDVWDTQFWDAVKFVLPEDSYGGNRVVFTTRIADVANASTMESQGSVYRMGFLKFQDSWTLFCKKIFKDCQCPAHLEDVAKSIVAKCEGLPLAILTIGGLLASKDSSRINEWKQVQSRLRNEFEGTGSLDRVKMIFSLSYNDLPSTLKACLLYTSIFPQGREIALRGLIQMLVAEGLVEQKQGYTAEESAWDCLKELANRSLIQFNRVLYYGMFGFIGIHDLLREFIASKAREQNMVSIISTTEELQAGGLPRKVVRRLVFNTNLAQIINPESHLYIKKCRCIFNFGEKKSVCKEVLAKFLISNLLTVVDLRGMDLEEIPKQIFRLFHLRRLALSGSRITTVPKSIERLGNLQSFHLVNTSVRELPVEFKNLHRLRHIGISQDSVERRLFPFNGFNAPAGMGELLQLQTLSVIDAAQSSTTRIVEEIGKLSKLGWLMLTNLRTEDGKELCNSLEKLSDLKELFVGSSVENNMAITLDLNHPISALSLQSLCWLGLFGGLEKMPPWIRSIQGLEKIELNYSNLADDPLETLQHLQQLSHLWMAGAYKGESLCFKAGYFLKLKSLVLAKMKGLRRVKFEKGAMPGINELFMEKLPFLEELPVGIEHLKQLEKLSLCDMNSQLVSKLERVENSEEEEEEEGEGEDFWKISHVPLVIVGTCFSGVFESHQLSKMQRIN